MGVKVPRAVVAYVFQELDQKERLLDVVAAEAEVLIVASQILIVEVDVEKLARVPRLRHRMREVQAGHVLVRHLRIHADHFRVVERLDEGQHVADRRQIEVAARLVRLRLQREAQIIALIDHIFTQKVERLLEPFSGIGRTLAGVRLCAFPPAPEDIRAGAALNAQVDGGHRLLQRVGPHLRVIAGEGAVPKCRVRKKIRRRHRHDQAVLVQRLFEVAHDPVAPGRGRIDRHQVVVMEVDAPRADLPQKLDQLHRRAHLPHRVAERVASNVADGPKTKTEFIFRFGCIGHELLLAIALNSVFLDLRTAPRRTQGYTES